MSVYLPKDGRTYLYDFRFRGTRHHGSTGMSRLRDAQEWERKERVRLERQTGDLALRARETPRCQEWAETFFEYKSAHRRIKRPDLLERELRVVLEFCGAKPETPRPKHRAPQRVVPIAPPYHDLRLGDFIETPEWVVAFERWIEARGTGGSARNHYRSVMSGLYRVAMLPEFRRLTGVRSNPFIGLARDRPIRRRVTQTVDELRAWVTHASPHVRAALAIGALAPALRLGSILALEWGRQIDPAFRYLTITDHKGDQARVEPIVIPITAQLRAILQQAHAEWSRQRMADPVMTAHVIQYHGKPVASIKKGLRAAAARAGVTYGIKAGGATFHTLRHTMASMLAEMGVAEAHRRDLLGHADIATTQIYTHLRPMHLTEPLERLSAAVALGDVMGTPATIRTRGRNRGTSSV